MTPLERMRRKHSILLMVGHLMIFASAWMLLMRFLDMYCSNDVAWVLFRCSLSIYGFLIVQRIFIRGLLD